MFILRLTVIFTELFYSHNISAPHRNNKTTKICRILLTWTFPKENDAVDAYILYILGEPDSQKNEVYNIKCVKLDFIVFKGWAIMGFACWR